MVMIYMPLNITVAVIQHWMIMNWMIRTTTMFTMLPVVVWIQKILVKTNQNKFNLAYVKLLKDVKHARTGPTYISAKPFQGSGNAACTILIRQLDNVRTPVVGNVMKYLMITQLRNVWFLCAPPVIFRGG